MLKLIGEDILYNGIKVAQLVDAPSTVTGDFIDYLNLRGGEDPNETIEELEDKIGDLEGYIDEIRDILEKI
ncbi:MAG: hypothetical protein KHX55_02395 [Proteobacteria bacterium]|nr:hypothetical protein [Pseudomonadota bacterium]